jgi:hypothetical protein
VSPLVLSASRRDVHASRVSRRASTRRALTLPCQVVRERGFQLIADRTFDLSAEGMLVPLGAAVDGGEPVIASFEIPGTWIDVEAVVTRVIHGRRPYDEMPAVGIAFTSLSPSARAALAGFLHGRPPPLPRRGPFARLRRGEGLPRLADELAMRAQLLPRPALALVEDELETYAAEALVADLDARAMNVHEVDDADVIDDIDPAAAFGLGVLVELAAAWRRLGEE